MSLTRAGTGAVQRCVTSAPSQLKNRETCPLQVFPLWPTLLQIRSFLQSRPDLLNHNHRMSESGKSKSQIRYDSLWPARASRTGNRCSPLKIIVPSSLNERPTHPSHLFVYSIRKLTCYLRKRGRNPCDLDCYMQPSRLRVFAIVRHLLHCRNVLRALNLRQESSHARQLSWVSYRHQTCLNTRSPI